MPRQFTVHKDAPALEAEFIRLYADADAMRRRIAALEAAAIAEDGDGGEDPDVPIGVRRLRTWVLGIEFDQAVTPATTYDWQWLLTVAYTQAYTHHAIGIVIMQTRANLDLQWTFSSGRTIYVPWREGTPYRRQLPFGQWRLLQTAVNSKGLHFPQPVWTGSANPEDTDWLYWPINAVDYGPAERFWLQLKFRSHAMQRLYMKAWVFGTFTEHYQRLFETPDRG